MACGHRFSAAVTSDGTIWTWGEGNLGQLGTGRCTKRSVPRPAIGPSATQNNTTVPETTQAPSFTAVACGSAHVLARTTSGKVYSWGFNNFGQLGLGDRKSRYSAAMVESISARTITAGGNSSGLVTDEGGLWTWGYCSADPTDNRLGYEASQCVLAPKLVEELESIRTSYAVIGDWQLLAFAPTTVTSLSPSSGPVEGGTQLKIQGSGFWDSENIKVKFTPVAQDKGGVGSEDNVTGKEDDGDRDDDDDDDDDDADESDFTDEEAESHDDESEDGVGTCVSLKLFEVCTTPRNEMH